MTYFGKSIEDAANAAFTGTNSIAATENRSA
jgi:hypothetical protein